MSDGYRNFMIYEKLFSYEETSGHDIPVFFSLINVDILFWLTIRIFCLLRLLVEDQF